MLEKYTFGQHDLTDITVIKCGTEDCLPGHSWGPGIRSHFVLHLITAGQGMLKTGKNEYLLERGDIFLVSPDTIAEYRADHEKPWSYVWVGFRGLIADSLCREAGLNPRQPVTKSEIIDKLADIIREMLKFSGGSRQHELLRIAMLYKFFAGLIDQNNQAASSIETRQAEYLRQAVRYIENNYADDISISGIASHVGLDRSYLYSLFQRFLHITPKAYLTRYRMTKAGELLRTSLSIGEVAHSVGYSDPLLFSKAFKREQGITPSNYRRDLEKNL
ncbi:MAG: AraC family transcriptional regulator [Clostridiaceae bacterium]|nr:AraC family transcriptional regulator [Clostridiaceae bacterium]